VARHRPFANNSLRRRLIRKTAAPYMPQVSISSSFAILLKMPHMIPGAHPYMKNDRIPRAARTAVVGSESAWKGTRRLRSHSRCACP
jgi:hypothetical protein